MKLRLHFSILLAKFAICCNVLSTLSPLPTGDGDQEQGADADGDLGGRDVEGHYGERVASERHAHREGLPGTLPVRLQALVSGFSAADL